MFHRRVLITTDVWARGIDVQQVSLVINYDLPAYALPRSPSFPQLTPPSEILGIVKIISTVSVALDASEGRVLPSTYVPF